MVKTHNIFIWVLVIILIIVGSIWLVLAGNKPGELDEFAQCIEESGAKFYGAFWCQHCQNQKALFGKSEELLPYVECSTSDGQGKNQMCEMAKIESYPTWTFPKGFIVTSEKEPTVCPIQPGPADQPEICGLEQGKVGSKEFKIWKFDNMSVRSNTDPIQGGNEWKFDKSAFANGELPLEFLAEQTGCQLPNTIE